MIFWGAFESAEATAAFKSQTLGKNIYILRVTTWDEMLTSSSKSVFMPKIALQFREFMAKSPGLFEDTHEELYGETFHSGCEKS